MLAPATRELLKTTLQSNRKSSDSSKRRLVNIEWVEILQRGGLKFRQQEKQILVASTKAGEKLFIQFPGKETALPGDRQRPWDFRPKVELASSGGYGIDFSFSHIWDILVDVFKRHAGRDDIYIRALASIFYRMAFMCDHCITPDGIALQTRCLTYDSAGVCQTNSFTKESFPPLYIFSPPDAVLDELSCVLGCFGNMSLEAFLRYNDLLAWNEDCKYFYRNRQTKNGEWIKGAGRCNNMLTHTSIIGFMLDNVNISDMAMRFARNKGVSACSTAELKEILGDFLTG